MSNADFLPHIRAKILQLPGGRQNWALLEDVVKGMTPQQQEAFYRTLVNANDAGVTEGRRDARRQPWKYMGS